jgi:hypothetical protein
MRRLLKILILTVTSTSGQIALGNELDWRLVSASSRGIGGVSCDKNSVTLTTAGQDLSLVMSKMNINMTAGEQPRTKYQWATCFIHLAVKIPRGFTISSNQTTLLGGILKDSGVSAYLDLVSAFTQRRPTGISPFVLGVSPIGPVMHIYRPLKYQDDINEPLFDLTKTSNFTVSQKQALCRLTAKQPVEIGYFVQISLAAARSSAQRNAVINLDNFDGHVSLKTSAEECVRN